MIGNQVTLTQRLPHNPGRIEWMKTLANMLQNQDVCAIVDPWNCVAKAKRHRTKALIAALPHFVFQFAGFSEIWFVHAVFGIPQGRFVRLILPLPGFSGIPAS